MAAAPRVLLQCCFDHPSSKALYGVVAERLREAGFPADFVLDLAAVDLSGYDLLVSHDPLPPEVLAREGLACFGGRPITRARSLELLRELGCPTMAWARAAGPDEVRALFERFRSDVLLLKRSESFGGKGTCLFDRAHVGALEWDPDTDVFCPLVDRRSGDVYKAELFNGELVIGWRSASPPLPGPEFDGFATGPRGAFGERSLHAFPRRWRRRLARLSAGLTERGFGYCSVDLMRTRWGRLVAIEINTALVATWWTARFDFVAPRYAEAVLRLVRAHAEGDRGRPARGAGYST